MHIKKEPPQKWSCTSSATASPSIAKIQNLPPIPSAILTEEGIDRTKQVAKRIAGFKIKPDLLISSPYVRAMQTAELFAAAFDYPKQKIRRSDSLLPGTEPSHFFKEIAKEKNSSIVFCFGHAPQLDDLLAFAIGAKHQVTQLRKPESPPSN